MKTKRIHLLHLDSKSFKKWHSPMSVSSKVMTSLLLSLLFQRTLGQPPLPEARCDCPCSPLACGGYVPCEYDIIFASFTHVDGPSVDKKAKLFFRMNLMNGPGLFLGLPPRSFNYWDQQVPEGETVEVNKLVHSIRVDCETDGKKLLRIEAVEKDAIGSNDEGSAELYIPLHCYPNNVSQFSTFETNIDLGSGKHDVKVVFHRILKTPPCTNYDNSVCPDVPPPTDYDDTPKPCKVTLMTGFLSHLDSPDHDKNGDFEVVFTVNGISSTHYLDVKRGSFGSFGNGDIVLFEQTLPCCEGSDSAITVPVKVHVYERDFFGSDFGSMEQEITLTCPPKSAAADSYEFKVDLFNRRGKGKFRHAVNIRLLTTTTEVNVCVTPPLPPKERPCVVAYTLLDVENLKSPKLDSRAEYEFLFNIGGVDHGSINLAGPYASIRKGETLMVNRNIATFEIPCGERRILPFEISGIEHDRDLSIDFITIENAEEFAHVSDAVEVECLPDPEVVVRTYTLDFKKTGKKKVIHSAKIRVEQRLINWSTACECTAVEPPSSSYCDMEIALRSLTHDSTSVGDNGADFTFTFWFNSMPVTTDPALALRSVYFDDVDKGDVVTLSPDGVFFDYGTVGNLLGTYYAAKVRIPVGDAMPLRIDFVGSEYDALAPNDVGSTSYNTKLYCHNEEQEINIAFELTQGKKQKVKHTGTLLLVVRPA